MRAVIAIIIIVLIGAVVYFIQRGSSPQYVAPAPVPTIVFEQPSVTPEQDSPTQGQISSTPSPAVNSSAITIQNFTFNSASMTVKKGTKVTWTNQDSAAHQIVSDPTGAIFKSDPLNTDDSYSFTFNQTGTFPYHCGTHPSMKGTVIVTP